MLQQPGHRRWGGGGGGGGKDVAGGVKEVEEGTNITCYTLHVDSKPRHTKERPTTVYRTLTASFSFWAPSSEDNTPNMGFKP